MPRSPTKVIDSKEKTILRSNLEYIKSNAFYVAPECMGEIWAIIGLELKQYLNNPPKDDWEWKVFEIITGSPRFP